MPKKKKTSKADKKKNSSNEFVLISEMDEFYAILNKVQVESQKARIIVETGEILPTIENILKDADFQYKIAKNRGKKNNLTFISILPMPKNRKEESIDMELEFFKDEILEDGQLF